jgi:hypothetical protein
MCLINGPIVNFIHDNAPGKITILAGDGVSCFPDHSLYVYGLEDINVNKRIGVLCTRSINDRRLILLPLDDESFVKGVVAVVSSRVYLPAWEERKPIVFWRGCLSGGVAPTIRTRVVWQLRNNPNADVKLTRTQNIWSDTHRGPVQDESLYTNETGLVEHVQHKYILILDGNCIASALQWVFASGSVPILITHPGNDWWFKQYLNPMVNYVPIQYDLSDLDSKIEWLINNDDAAREITKSALHFAETILSSEFQKAYLIEQLKRTDRGESGGASCESGGDDGDHPQTPPTQAQ